jgi:hypothetical protein
MNNIKNKEIELFNKFCEQSADEKHQLLKDVYILAESNKDLSIPYTANVLDMIKTILLNKSMSYSQWKSLSMYKRNNMTDNDIRKQLGIN